MRKCKLCGSEMYELESEQKGMFFGCLAAGHVLRLRGAVVWNGEKIIEEDSYMGCDCGYCLDRTPIARLGSCLQETATPATIPQDLHWKMAPKIAPPEYAI